MSQTAAHLVDHVIPHFPVRQWVLSLPIPLRLRLAAPPELFTPMLQVVKRLVTRHLRDRAGLNADEGHAGVVTLIQRFGSSTNLNIHLHAWCLTACTSAGGALVPLAVLKEPDVFAAMVLPVAVLNASQIGAATNGASQFDEMGDPVTPEAFKALLAMDAYHLLATAKPMPDTLLTIGMNDKRVSPWMSAEFAARAQAKCGDERTIWLRTETDSSHGGGTPEGARVAEFADIPAFAWDRSR